MLGCLGILLVVVGGFFLLFGLVGVVLSVGFGIAGGVLHAIFSGIAGIFHAIFH